MSYAKEDAQILLDNLLHKYRTCEDVLVLFSDETSPYEDILHRNSKTNMTLMYKGQVVRKQYDEYIMNKDMKKYVFVKITKKLFNVWFQDTVIEQHNTYKTSGYNLIGSIDTKTQPILVKERGLVRKSAPLFKLDLNLEIYKKRDSNYDFDIDEVILMHYVKHLCKGIKYNKLELLLSYGLIPQSFTLDGIVQCKRIII